MLKKTVAVLLLGTVLCSMAAVPFADANSPKFAFNIKYADVKHFDMSTSVLKNDNEQICYVTTEKGNLSAATGFYVRCRDHAGNHEATEAKQLTSNSAKYKLKYTVQTGVKDRLYRLRGETDQAMWCEGRWNP